MNLRSILGFAFGPMGAALLSLFAVPLTAWVFSPADVGRLNVLQITLSFALLLSVLGLDQAYVREFHEAKDRAQLLRSCFAPGFLLLLVLGGISAFFAVPLAQWLYAEANPWWYWATLGTFFISYVSRFLSLILRMQERGWAYSASQVLPKAMQLLLILAAAWSVVQKTFTHLLLITLASLAVVLAVYAWNTRNDWRKALDVRIDSKQLQGLLAFGTPLIFSSLAFWGLSATSTIGLRAWSTLDELAIYSVANSFAGAAIVFQAIFSVVWAPTVYKWAAEGEKLEKIHKVNRYVLLCIVVLFSLIAIFSWLASSILPANYAAVQWVLIPCLASPLLYTLSETTVVGIGITKRSSFALLASFIAFVFNIGLSYLLIPEYGATGAAISSAVAFWLFFVLRTEFAIYLWKPMPRLSMYSYSSIAIFGAIVSSLHGKKYTIELQVFWLFYLFSAFFVFKSEIIEAQRFIQKKINTNSCYKH